MRRLIACVICAAMPCAARAQDDDFSHLKLKTGQVVYVTDTTTGVEVGGALTGLSPTVLTVGSYSFSPRGDLRIERRGDPIWDGAAIGFGLGAFVLYPVLPEAGRAGVFRPINGLLGAGIGALIDLAHTGRTTVYTGRAVAENQRRWSVVPTIGTHTKAVVAATRFH